MPIPKPKKDEKEKDFISRCMGNATMVKEYSDQKRRTGVCYSAWRKVHGGKKPKANMSVNTCITNVQTRIEQFEGKQHLVAPVVMLVEGVHHNSWGALYYPASEISDFIEAWNGVPVTVDHPKDVEGNPISANHPGIIEAQSVGRIWNTSWDQERLKSEIWIDIEKAKQLAPDMLTSIQNDKQLEISTGHFSDHDLISGIWNEEEYEAVVKNIKPDHLALLPEGVGACSWDDGCGIRINMRGGDKVDEHKYLSPFFNEISHGDLRQQLRSILPAGSEDLYYYIRDVFDGYFIYIKEEKEKATLYKQAYAKDANDQVSLVGEPVEVIEKTEYITANIKKEDLKMSKKAEEKCCPEKVAALIANKGSRFDESHQEWLESLTEDQLDLLQPGEPEKIDHFMVVNWEKLDEEQIQTVKDKLNLVEKKEDDAGQPQTVDEYVANAPTEMQSVLRNGLRMHKENKAKLVSELIANKRNKFTQEQLESKEIEELEALVALAQAAPPDYSANSPDNTSTEDEEPLEIPTLQFDNK